MGAVPWHAGPTHCHPAADTSTEPAAVSNPWSPLTLATLSFLAALPTHAVGRKSAQQRPPPYQGAFYKPAVVGSLTLSTETCSGLWATHPCTFTSGSALSLLCRAFYKLFLYNASCLHVYSPKRQCCEADSWCYDRSSKCEHNHLGLTRMYYRGHRISSTKSR